MRVSVHPRVRAKHAEITDADAVAAFRDALRSVPREGTGFPPQWLGVGPDGRGRILEFVAVQVGEDEWLIFHAMRATTKVLIELGLRRR